MIDLTQLTEIFNEWARRYQEDPESFSKVLDLDGNVIDDYAVSAATMFLQIQGELNGKNL
jgi:hypothetical protein